MILLIHDPKVYKLISNFNGFIKTRPLIVNNKGVYVLNPRYKIQTKVLAFEEKGFIYEQILKTILKKDEEASINKISNLANFELSKTKMIVSHLLEVGFLQAKGKGTGRVYKLALSDE